MNSRIIFINIVLAGFVIYEVFSVVQLWSSKELLLKSVNTASIRPLRFKITQLFREKEVSLSGYNDITQNNLFAPEREEFIPEVIDPEPELEPEVSQEPVIEELDTNKITLFGVIIIDDLKKALISDVENKSRSNSIWVEKGNTLDGFMVEAIEKDRMIVSRSGKKYSILLYDEKKPKKREFIPKKIVNKKKVVKPPLVKPVKSSVSSKKQDDEYETISTPFGEFKRKKKK